MNNKQAPETWSRVWLVTGCSSGFGRLFIPAITARGDRVIATARELGSLRDFEGNGDVKLLQLDITQSQVVLNDTVAEAIQVFGHIDVVIHCAGYVLSGVWEEVSHTQTVDLFNTNVLGPLNLTRSILPHMRARKAGSIVFMSSLAAWLGIAAGGPYSASKFALEGAVESLQREVESFGVEVLLVVLGLFRTGILSPAKRKMSRLVKPIPEYDAIYEALQYRLVQADGNQPGDPVQAVERIVDVVRYEGYMAGRQKMPLRIVFGSDVMGTIRGQCQEILDAVAEQEEHGKSTDFANEVKVQTYG